MVTSTFDCLVFLVIFHVSLCLCNKGKIYMRYISQNNAFTHVLKNICAYKCGNFSLYVVICFQKCGRYVIIFANMWQYSTNFICSLIDYLSTTDYFSTDHFAANQLCREMFNSCHCTNYYSQIKCGNFFGKIISSRKENIKV